MTFSINPISGINESRNYTVVVKNGFLKALDASNSNSTDDEKIHCWTSSHVYTETGFNLNLAQYDKVCENDPGFYQYCGAVPLETMGRIQTFRIQGTLCGCYICTYKTFPFLGDKSPTQIESGLKRMQLFQCSEHHVCENEDAEHLRETDCDGDKWFRCNISDETIPRKSLCDGISDCLWAEDETALGCHHDFGTRCNGSKPIVRGAEIWRSPPEMCRKEDHNSVCMDDLDIFNKSEFCSPSAQVGSCIQGNKTVPLFEKQMCGALNFHRAESDLRLEDNLSWLCHDGKDQINCTNSDVVFHCSHSTTGNVISLTDSVLCKDLNLCGDNMSNLCESPETSCNIHRHFICDGKVDCDNGHDERFCEELQTDVECIRRVRNVISSKNPSKILRAWVRDNVQDCEDGEDENIDMWKECKYKINGGKTVKKISYKNKADPCNTEFVCRDPLADEPVLIDPNHMCDGTFMKENCPVASKICKLSRDKEVNVTVLSQSRTRKFLPPCLPGLKSEANNSHMRCKIYIMEASYGTAPIEIFAPVTAEYNCENLFGEFYVYAACLNLCTNERVKCPIRRTDYLTSCPEMNERILTLTKEGNLTFVERFEDKFINKEMFPCENGRCVHFNQVCDLVNDCGDHSDEKNCENHFDCGNDATELIKLTQFCDGTSHCSKSTDECNERCPKENNKSILSYMVLQIFGWLIGIPATLMNGFMILRNLAGIIKGENSSAVSLSIACLVSLIALGDFCVGLYLVCISIENVARSEGFCKNEQDWVTSPSCEFYGVISTFGSELSVFAMTSLSVYRAYVMRRLDNAQRPKRRFKVLLGLGCTMLLALALLIAVIPIEPNLNEAYFNNGYYIKNANFFLAPKRSTEYWPILQEYFGVEEISKMANNSKSVRSKVEEMFSRSNEPHGEHLKFSTLGFYGSSGSCTFKFFVDKDDPQKHYTWAILIINLLSLFIISAGYLSVHFLTQTSANKVGAKNKFGALQRKITFIIVTDFLCWLPFIIVCFIHYFDDQIFKESRLYPVFATIVLPINSIINPLLYDTILSTLSNKLWQKISGFKNFLSARLRRWRAMGGDVNDSKTVVGLRFDEFGKSLQVSRNGLNNSRVSQVTAC